MSGASAMQDRVLLANYRLDLQYLMVTNALAYYTKA